MTTVYLPLHERARRGLMGFYAALAQGAVAFSMAPINALAVFSQGTQEVDFPVGETHGAHEAPHEVTHHVEHTHTLGGGDEEAAWLKEHRRQYGEDDED